MVLLLLLVIMLVCDGGNDSDLACFVSPRFNEKRYSVKKNKGPPQEAVIRNLMMMKMVNVLAVVMLKEKKGLSDSDFGKVPSAWENGIVILPIAFRIMFKQSPIK